jgi:hypothetical protein
MGPEPTIRSLKVLLIKKNYSEFLILSQVSLFHHTTTTMFPKLPPMKPYNPSSSYPYLPCRLSPQTEPEKRALVLNTIQMALSIVDLMDFQTPSRTTEAQASNTADSLAARPSANVSSPNSPPQHEEEEDDDENYGGILATEALEEEEDEEEEDCMEE